MVFMGINLMFAPLNCRGGCYFWLDPKVTKRSRQKKASTLQARLPGPLFCRAFTRLNHFVTASFLCFIIFPMLLWGPSADKLRAKAEKTAGLKRRAGHRKFLHCRVFARKGHQAKRFQPAVFWALCVKGLARNEAFLLT